MKVNCVACSGKGKRVMGGMASNCRSCDGNGYKLVNEKPKKRTSSSQTSDHAPKKADIAPIVEVKEPEIAKSAPIVAEPIVKDVEVDKKPDIISENVTNEPKVIFEGYDNAVMEAILAEGKMSSVDWKKKYTAISETYAVEDRQAIMLAYAKSRPVAPRKVDIMQSQDVEKEKKEKVKA